MATKQEEKAAEQAKAASDGASGIQEFINLLANQIGQHPSLEFFAWVTPDDQWIKKAACQLAAKKLIEKRNSALIVWHQLTLRLPLDSSDKGKLELEA